MILIRVRMVMVQRSEHLQSEEPRHGNNISNKLLRVHRKIHAKSDANVDE